MLDSHIRLISRSLKKLEVLLNRLGVARRIWMRGAVDAQADMYCLIHRRAGAEGPPLRRIKVMVDAALGTCPRPSTKCMPARAAPRSRPNGCSRPRCSRRSTRSAVSPC